MRRGRRQHDQKNGRVNVSEDAYWPDYLCGGMCQQLGRKCGRCGAGVQRSGYPERTAGCWACPRLACLPPHRPRLFSAPLQVVAVEIARQR
jgi:hypothetical protein